MTDACCWIEEEEEEEEEEGILHAVQLKFGFISHQIHMAKSINSTLYFSTFRRYLYYCSNNYLICIIYFSLVRSTYCKNGDIYIYKNQSAVIKVKIKRE